MQELSSGEEKAYYALTSKAFGLLAPVYNLMTLPLTGVRRQVVDFADPRRGSLVLDVATGTGQQAFAFAECGVQVVGVDLTEAMLRVARKQNREGLVKFEAGDATQLGYADDHFDLTCVSFALHDMPPSIRAKVLREMVRVTKNDGTLMIVDYGLPSGRVSRTLAFGLISLYERGYYREFIGSNLLTTLEEAGIQVTGELDALTGIARILKGRKRG